FIEWYRPVHALHAPDPLQIVLQHRLDIVAKPNRRIHDPEIRPGDVGDLRAGTQHKTAKERALLRDQKRGERQTKHDAQKLGPIANEHLESDPPHRRPPFMEWSLPRGERFLQPRSAAANSPGRRDRMT